MSHKRQIRRRAEQKAAKKAKKETKEAVAQLATMPDKCSSCNAVFDIKNDFYLDNWMISVTNSGIRMLCDVCKESD
jgi:hypothetical protein